MIRHLPAPRDKGGRVETGAVKFGDDWAGLFVRGDDAFGLGHNIKVVLEHINPEMMNSDMRLMSAVGRLLEFLELIDGDVFES